MRLVNAREQGRESGSAAGFGNQTQFLPKSFLGFDNVIVGNQQRLRDKLLRDGKHQFADASGSKRIRGNPANLNVDNLPGRQALV
jgi:hypothetical protein